jgi:Tfp pilus assembly protein PilO
VFGALTLMMTLATVGLIVDTQRTIGETRTELADLRVKLDGLEARAAEEQALTAQLDSLEKSAAELSRILPSPEVATREDLLRTLQQAGTRSGLKVERVLVR